MAELWKFAARLQDSPHGRVDFFGFQAIWLMVRRKRLNEIRKSALPITASLVNWSISITGEAVPEPGTTILLVLGCLALRRRRR